MGQGFSYFAAGGVGGVVSIYATPIAGGLKTGALNGAITSYYATGSVDAGSVIMGGVTGGIMAGAGQVMDGLASNMTSGIFSNIASPVLRNSLSNATGGAIAGFGMGALGTAMNGGNFSQSMKGGLQGTAQGAAIGGVMGIGQGIAEARANNLNPWSRKPLNPVRVDIEKMDVSGDYLRSKYEMGQEGLRLNNFTQNTERIYDPSFRAAYRVPDEMIKLDKLTVTKIGEVKHYSQGRKLGLTNQIQDIINYCNKHNIGFDLYVPHGVKLSTPLMNAMNSNPNFNIKRYYYGQ